MENTKDIEIVETGWEWDVAARGEKLQAPSIRLQADTAVFACGKSLSESPELEARDLELSEACGKSSFAFDLVAGAMWLVMFVGVIVGAVSGICGY